MADTRGKLGQDPVWEELFSSRRTKYLWVQIQDQKVQSHPRWPRKMQHLPKGFFCCFEDGAISSYGKEIAKVMCVIILGGTETVMLRAETPACEP